MPLVLTGSIFTAFGLITGSFLNAVIYRLHSGESPFKGRSHCPHCKKTLNWYELVPVFSFIAQKGKCRGCGDKISFQYPVVEIGTALLFVLVSIHANEAVNILTEPIFYILYSIFLAFIASGLVVIFVYDLKHYIIPDKVLLPLVILTAIYRLAGFWTLGHWDLIRNWKLEIVNLEGFFTSLLLALLAALPFAAIHFISKGRAMGFGDVKFAFFMGLLLGYPAVLSAMFIAFVLGAIIGIGLMLAGKKSLQSKVPFGPFLIIGTFMALLWSEELISFYLNLFL